MNDDIDAAADRAAIAARTAVKVKSQSRRTSAFIPLVAVAFAILSGVYLYMTDTGPAQPTGPMPVPHVQAPGQAPTPAPPAEPAR